MGWAEQSNLQTSEHSVGTNLTTLGKLLLGNNNKTYIEKRRKFSFNCINILVPEEEETLKIPNVFGKQYGYKHIQRLS